ncbi:acyl-CoA thioesterase, partial [Aliarcobacter butzleri]
MGKLIKREQTLTMTMLMTPDKANFSGKYVHGGDIFKMLDLVAHACAARYPGPYPGTLSV